MFHKSRKDTLVDQAQSLAHDLTEAIVPRVEKARDDLAPVLADVRDAGAARLADARVNAAPYVESARDRTLLGVQQVMHDVRDQAHQAAAEAERRRDLAGAALRGEPVKKTSKGKRLLLILVLGAIGAVVGKKLAGGDQSDNWQSSYTPAPAPAAPVTTATHPVTTPDDPAEDIDVTTTPDPKV